MSSIYTFIWASFRMALSQLMRHKVRSFLTLLGILIGVGSVVAIVSLGEGLRGIFMQNIASASAMDLLYVMPDVPMNMHRVNQPPKPFKNRDVQAVEQSELVQRVFAGHILSGIRIKHSWRSANVTVQLIDYEYLPIDGWKLARGRFYTTAEDRARANVCMVGDGIKDAVYAKGEEVLGSQLIINGVRFTVVGIFKQRSAMEGGQQANEMVMMPLATGQARMLGSDDLYWMAVQLKPGADMLLTKDDVSQRLRASRRIRNAKDDDFTISTTEDFAKFANNFVDTLIMVFGVVAVIALAVGGVGVMNIMLVSVRERTREIGLRKALGATPLLITWQFLMESMTLTLSGGVLGLVLGFALGGGVALVLKATLDVFWTPSVPVPWIIGVLGTSVGLGLIFGVYPAFRAGQLDPIVALRYQ
jgi:putative ABC transport system permease protein